MKLLILAAKQSKRNKDIQHNKINRNQFLHLRSSNQKMLPFDKLFTLIKLPILLTVD